LNQMLSEPLSDHEIQQIVRSSNSWDEYKSINSDLGFTPFWPRSQFNT
jgi:hypothetical protein